MFKPLKDRIFWIMYGFVGTLVIVLSLEGAVRLLKLAPPLHQYSLGGYGGNVKVPYLPYKPQPLSGGCYNDKEFGRVCAHYNSLGFRDEEHNFSKSEGVFRILGLGDSFTQGAGVNFEDTYLYVLEKILNSRTGAHPKIEIIKAGIGGYSAEPERILLQYYGLKFKPDLILVGFLPNDVWDAYVGMGNRTVTDDGYLTTNEAAQLGKVGLKLYIHSHVCRMVLAKYVEHQTKKKFTMPWSEVWYPNEHSERAWKTIEAEYGQMFALARMINAQIVFIHIPQIPHPVGGWGSGVTYPNLRLHTWCKANNVHFIDTIPAMMEAYSRGENLYYLNDGHCNAKGYKVIAEAIYSGLTTLGLVP